MSELNVFFWGLVCHINARPDARTSPIADYAALVNAPYHVPMIVFSPKPEDIYVLDEDFDIGFEHGTEPADIDAESFDAAVPKLQSILGGILRLQPDDAMLCRYPAADTGRPRLSVQDTYGYTATHRSKFSGQSKRHDQPVGRIIRLRVPLDRDKVTVQFRGTNKVGNSDISRTIPADSCVLITNVEDTFAYDAGVNIQTAAEQLQTVLKSRSDDDRVRNAVQLVEDAGRDLQIFAKNLVSQRPNHFEHFSKLLAGADTVIAKEFRKEPAMTQNPGSCEWVVKYVNKYAEFARGGVKPECGNTTFP
jgi:hypothetical protein